MTSKPKTLSHDSKPTHDSSSARAAMQRSCEAVFPEITVIVPVHDGAAHLKSCLESIMASVYPSYSCIVVNDGSGDETASIAARFPTSIVTVEGGPLGPAYARNRGAAVAHGSILFFVDCDVAIAPRSVEQVSEIFRRHPEVDAIFGSYDADPAAPGFISQYRNLLHYFVHQNGRSQASTFWAGCGAIRKSVFRQIGGFDEKRFPQPSIEDIELGYRLREAGHRIRLVPSLQGKHMKAWTFHSMIKNDIMQRAIPWSRLILESQHIPNDLNLSWRHRFSAILIVLASICLALSWLRPALLAVSAAFQLSVIILNRDLYLFFARHRGRRFAIGCVPLHFIYYLSSVGSYLSVWTHHKLKRILFSITFS